MSGGTFDYKQHFIEDIADSVETFLRSESSTNYPSNVLAEIEHGLTVIRKAAVYAQRIDWLLAGDDGPKQFLSRLENELEELRRAR